MYQPTFYQSKWLCWKRLLCIHSTCHTWDIWFWLGEELVTTVINFFIYNIRKEFIRCYPQIADITEGKRGLLRFAKMTARNGNNATPWISIIIKLSQANGIFQSDLVFRLKINSTCTLSTVNYFWYFSWKIVRETRKTSEVFLNFIF